MSCSRGKAFLEPWDYRYQLVVNTTTGRSFRLGAEGSRMRPRFCSSPFGSKCSKDNCRRACACDCKMLHLSCNATFDIFLVHHCWNSCVTSKTRHEYRRHKPFLGPPFTNAVFWRHLAGLSRCWEVLAVQESRIKIRLFFHEHLLDLRSLAQSQMSARKRASNNPSELQLRSWPFK